MSPIITKKPSAPEAPRTETATNGAELKHSSLKGESLTSTSTSASRSRYLDEPKLTALHEKLLKEGTARELREIVREMAIIDPEYARSAAKSLLRDQDPERRLSGVHALAAIRKNDAIDAAALLLKDPTLTERAFTALHSLSPDRAQIELSRLASDKSPTLQTIAGRINSVFFS